MSNSFESPIRLGLLGKGLDTWLDLLHLIHIGWTQFFWLSWFRWLDTYFDTSRLVSLEPTRVVRASFSRLGWIDYVRYMYLYGELTNSNLTSIDWTSYTFSFGYKPLILDLYIRLFYDYFKLLSWGSEKFFVRREILVIFIPLIYINKDSIFYVNWSIIILSSWYLIVACLRDKRDKSSLVWSRTLILYCTSSPNKWGNNPSLHNIFSRVCST